MGGHMRVFSEIESLQADFPGFVIWGEIIMGRVTYVAQARAEGTNPRVVTARSLERLRARLEEPLVSFDPTRPNVARVYDCLLGGKTNFAVDRDEAARLLKAYPLLGELARENRQFLARAVTCVARQGVTQFIDVGAGLPTSPNTHEIAHQANPAARVAYVDNDPLVITHARCLLAKSPGVVAVPGDLRDPDAILGSPALAGLIDLAEPVCVLLAAVLHFLDTPTAAKVTAAFTRAMAPGSYLVLSVGHAGPGSMTAIHRAYTAAPLHHHAEEDIGAFFSGLDLMPPGLVAARSWYPPGSVPPGPDLRGADLRGADLRGTERAATVLAGAGRKPALPRLLAPHHQRNPAHPPGRATAIALLQPADAAT
jgi:hypothetical protein